MQPKPQQEVPLFAYVGRFASPTRTLNGSIHQEPGGGGGGGRRRRRRGNGNGCHRSSGGGGVVGAELLLKLWGMSLRSPATFCLRVRQRWHVSSSGGGNSSTSCLDEQWAAATTRSRDAVPSGSVWMVVATNNANAAAAAAAAAAVIAWPAGGGDGSSFSGATIKNRATTGATIPLPSSAQTATAPKTATSLSSPCVFANNLSARVQSVKR